MSSRNDLDEGARGAPGEQHAPRSPTGGKRLLLSILIPAYRYPDGVARILAGLGEFDPDWVEILIGDDSPEAMVEAVVQRTNRRGIHYRRNVPPLGAPGNWNALLARASGEYCLMLHHDEFPLSADFLPLLLRRLTNSPSEDVLLLDCVLVNTRTGWNRRHLPFPLRMAVVSRVSTYLLRRNVVGPVSVLVIRRSLYPTFDLRLKWLVDVDVYLRLFTPRPAVVACREIAIGSVLGRNESITNQLGSGLAEIAAEERMYLLRKHGSLAYWCKEGLAYRLMRMVEKGCWICLRIVIRIFGWPPPVTRETAIRATRQGGGLPL